MVTQPAKYQFTVEAFHQMATAGILNEDSRVELIAGEIYAMTPIGSRHAAVVAALNELFSERLLGKVTVWPQNPLHLGPKTELQPDLLLLKRREDRYRSGHPTAEDVLLLIEVSDTTLHFDRTTKLPLYAQAGIKEVWIVNLVDNRIEVYGKPDDPRYTENRMVTMDQTVSPMAFPEAAISANEVLG